MSKAAEYLPHFLQPLKHSAHKLPVYDNIYQGSTVLGNYLVSFLVKRINNHHIICLSSFIYLLIYLCIHILNTGMLKSQERCLSCDFKIKRAFTQCPVTMGSERWGMRIAQEKRQPSIKEQDTEGILGKIQIFGN